MDPDLYFVLMAGLHVLIFLFIIIHCHDKTNFYLNPSFCHLAVTLSIRFSFAIFRLRALPQPAESLRAVRLEYWPPALRSTGSERMMEK